MTVWRADYRTAIALARALIAGDVEGMAAVERYVDPVELISALTALAVSLGILLDGDRDRLDRRLASWLADLGAE